MRYLSDEWLAEAGRALDALAPCDPGGRVRFDVADGPDGPRHYVLVLGPDRVAISTDDEPCELTMRTDWDTARRIATGDASAQRAVLDGDLVLDGDVQVLLGNASAMADVDDRLADLRARTEF